MNRSSAPRQHASSVPQSWGKRLLIGAGFGAFFGALHSMYYERWLAGLLAGMVGGASFYSLIGLLCCYLKGRGLKTILLGLIAGFVSGIMWWLVARPPTPLLLVACISAVGGAFVIGWELEP